VANSIRQEGSHTEMSDAMPGSVFAARRAQHFQRALAPAPIRSPLRLQEEIKHWTNGNDTVELL